MNLAPKSVSMLRAAKTIVLQACDVENTLERTSVMAPKGVSLILATYYVCWSLQCDKLREKKTSM